MSLGLLRAPTEMAMAGVVLLTVVACSFNRALGVPMPLWAVKE